MAGQRSVRKRKAQQQIAYKAHAACDRHSFVPETVVTLGNIHKSVAFDAVYDKVMGAFPEAKAIIADSAYKAPHICKKGFDDERVLSAACKHPQTMKGRHAW